LFGIPRWRRHAIIGLVMATSGVVGLWGIGFFSVDLVRSVFRKSFEQEFRTRGYGEEDRAFVRTLLAEPASIAPPKDAGRLIGYLIDPDVAREKPDAQVLARKALALDQAPTAQVLLNSLDADGQTSEERQRRAAFLEGAVINPSSGDETHWNRLRERTKELEGRLTLWAGINGLLLNVGAFFGIYAFTRLTHHVGRRPAFAVTYLLAMASTALTFWYLNDFIDILWMAPMMGFFQIALFGGFAIYFPELFPTRIRSTGTSFCYNVGRYVASPGPLLLGVLASRVFGHYGEVLSWRMAGVSMCSFFLLGLIALIYAPETRGQPLPE
jgi:hypothetical protein